MKLVTSSLLAAQISFIILFIAKSMKKHEEEEVHVSAKIISPYKIARRFSLLCQSNFFITSSLLAAVFFFYYCNQSNFDSFAFNQLKKLTQYMGAWLLNRKFEKCG